MNFTFEKNKLKNYLGKELYDHLKKSNLILAGGAITSLFTNSEINDLDIYGKTNEDIYNFAEEFVESGSWIVSHTKKATQFTYEGKSVQLIHYSHFPTIDDLFNSFDYTVCMGAFDFSSEEFVLHPDFMKHNSQRFIKFNSRTDYPIVSALRVQKYENKGYKISKPEYIRIVMACMNLNITSYEELKDHLGGMYGISYDKLFEGLEDDEFDLQLAMNRLENISLTEEYFDIPEVLDIKLEEVLEDIDKSEKVVFAHRNKKYRIQKNGNIKLYKSSREADREVRFEDAFAIDKLYKFVKKKDDGVFSSFYDSSFPYETGETSKAKGSNYSYGGGKLYFNTKDSINESSYFDRSDKALIEVGFNIEDLIDIQTDDSITASKVKTIREVPREEWEQWINKDMEIANF